MTHTPGAALAACAGLIIAVAPSTGLAQQDSLDEIVVTATRRPFALRDVARSVSVVDKEQIQNGTQELALDESLAGVPGLYMLNRYNFAQDLRISLRGFGARSSFGIRGIRIFVDDIPETLPDGQAQVDSIDLGSAERIEVLRGPASSLYGNGAGGVIAVYSEAGGGDPYVEAGLAGGDYGYRKAQLKTAGSIKAVDFMINASRLELDGYRELSRTEGVNVNGRLGIRLPGNDQLLLALNHTDQPEAQDAGGLNAAEVAADRRAARALNVQFDAGEALRQERLGLVYKGDRLGGNVLLRNYYVWRDFSNLLPFVAGGAVDLGRFFYGVGGQYSTGDPDSGPLTLSTGFDIDRQNDDRRRYDNNDGVIGALVFDQQEKVDAGGIYAQLQYTPAENWAISGGLRYDRVTFDVTDRYLDDGDDSGKLDFDEWSPSLALNYQWTNAVLYASWSSSFETPTTTELANPDGSGGFNKRLRPQLADNFEIGARLSLNGVAYELTAFRIDLRDELVPYELASSPGRTFYANAGSSTRDGIEAGLSWRGDAGFGVDVSYTWSDFTFDEFVDDAGNDFAGKRLPGLPEHFGYLGLSYAAGGWSTTFETLYTGNFFADNGNSTAVRSYPVSNLRLSYEIRNRRWRIRPYFGINNLFDQAYNSNIRINAFGARYYEPAPMRNFYAGFVVRFQKSP